MSCNRSQNPRGLARRYASGSRPVSADDARTRRLVRPFTSMSPLRPRDRRSTSSYQSACTQPDSRSRRNGWRRALQQNSYGRNAQKGRPRETAPGRPHADQPSPNSVMPRSRYQESLRPGCGLIRSMEWLAGTLGETSAKQSPPIPVIVLDHAKHGAGRTAASIAVPPDLSMSSPACVASG